MKAGSEFERNPFDVIAGNTKLREDIEAKESLSAIQESWKEDEAEFSALRKPYLLYGE